MKKLSEQAWNRKNDGLRRTAVFLGASAVILTFSLCAPPNAERFDMIGMELAVVALAIFLWKLPMRKRKATAWYFSPDRSGCRIFSTPWKRSCC